MTTVEEISNGKALLAPMLGTSDGPFRAVCRAFDAGLISTEMVSSQSISDGLGHAFRYASFDASEAPVSIQLAAASEDVVIRAIRELAPRKPAFFDLNFGCPNDRICLAGAGARVLDDPARLGRIVRAAVRASDVRVSVKMRAFGSRRDASTAERARIAEDNGAIFITVHARGRHTPYEEAAEWQFIAEAKAATTIPVVGNGDVFSSRDARALREATGCDAVMIGRGALGTPWIFRDVALGRACGAFDFAPDAEELLALIRLQAMLLERTFGPFDAVPRLRKHAAWYLRRYEDAEALRHRIFVIEGTDAILGEIETFLSAGPSRYDPDSVAAERIERAFRERVLFWMTEAYV